MPQTSKHRSVTDLCKTFEKALTAMRAVPMSPLSGPDPNEKAFNRAVSECSRIARQIAAASANSINEMLLKISVIGWCAGASNRSLETYNNWMPGRFCDSEEFHALVSLRTDLHRITVNGHITLCQPFEAAGADHVAN